MLIKGHQRRTSTCFRHLLQIGEIVHSVIHIN
jgi:hypothetical protein